jgi:adenosylcobinamide kinase / adenosylcobinamide-phosphate guanylyltransferase
MVDASNETRRIARSELIIGGQKSGKSARAEKLAMQWLAASPTHHAVLLATAQAHDAEMQARIARHQADRATRVPAMRTVEQPLHLAQAIAQYSTPQTLIVVDCLTLWLTNQLFPYKPYQADLSQNNITNKPESTNNTAQAASFLIAIKAAMGPVVIVSNEIGLGVIPMGFEVRAYVDTLGRLNQDVASVCARVTLMAAGLPLILKDI